MQKPLISIILPIYNVEKYIADCVRSVGVQTMRRFELIMVDDASTDGSVSVAKKALAEYPDIDVKWACFTENKGVSAARNKGLDLSQGEYILFVDPDDELTQDALERLSAPLAECSPDMIIASYRVTGTERSYPGLFLEDGFIGGQEAIKKAWLSGKWYSMVWNKLYRADYLRFNGHRFNEKVRRAEDDLWSVEGLFTMQSMYVVGACTYIYKLRPNSITTSSYLPSALSENWAEMLRCFHKFIGQKRLRTDKLTNDIFQRFFLLAVEAALPYGHEEFRQNYLRMRAALPDARWRYLLAGHWRMRCLKRDFHWVLPSSLAVRCFFRRYCRKYHTEWLSL